MEVTGCGMLPMYEKDNEIYLLCGIYKGKINDLGGRIEANETTRECAAREFYEETVGLVDTYENLLNHKIHSVINLKFHNKLYISYVYETQYVSIEEEYSRLIEYVKNNKCKSSSIISYKNYDNEQLYKDHIYPKGYYEVDEIKWIKLNDLLKMLVDKDRKLHYRLRNILYQLNIYE